MKNLLPAVSVLISAAGLLYAWRKDRLLKKREVADRIRRAAATLTAKLERWKQVALRFFDEVQPLITDTDVLVTTKHNIVAARDFWWRSAIAARSTVTRIILDEQIELAYAELYGYDASVRDLFTQAIAALRRTDELAFGQLMIRTQRDVLGRKRKEGDLKSAELGNQLRASCAEVRERLSIAFEDILLPIRSEMLKLINANDDDLFAKRITLSNWKMVMPATSDLQEQQPDERYQTISEFIDHMINDEICLPIIAIERKGTSLLRTFARGEQALSEDRLGNDRKGPVLGHNIGPKDITG